MVSISASACGSAPRTRTPYEALVAALAEDALRARVGAPASPCLPAAVARWVDTTFGPDDAR